MKNKHNEQESTEIKDEIEGLIEEIIDNLIEYDNGGSMCYSTSDIATKCFDLRSKIKILFADLEERIEVGEACVWAFHECIQEGSAVEWATERLVKRYRNAIAEQKERLEFEKRYREATNPIGKDVESEDTE